MHCLFKDVETNKIVEVNLNSKGESDQTSEIEAVKEDIDSFLIE